MTSLLLFLTGIATGVLGALVGIGGGVVLVPALLLGFGLNIKVAVATSLVSVIATSTAAGSAYVKEGVANMRLGVVLEIATALGGLSGGLIAAVVPGSVIAGVFSVVMFITAVLLVRDVAPATLPTAAAATSAGPTMRAMATSFDDQGELVAYQPRRLGAGMGVSSIAGVLSGLLGVGGGFVKVPAMNLVMGVPIKAAAATSNFMIGVTALASLTAYLARGDVDPAVAAPVALGITIGAVGGTRLSAVTASTKVKGVLAVVLVGVAIQMLFFAMGHRLGG